MLLAAQIIMDSFSQSSGSFSMDNTDAFQVGNIGVVRYLSSSAMASSTVRPRRLISVETLAWTYVFFRLLFSEERGGDHRFIHAQIRDVLERIIPICTKRKPLESDGFHSSFQVHTENLNRVSRTDIFGRKLLF